MSTLRERNKERVLQRIIDAANDLFMSAGYDQTTIDDIAARAEISRGTLFKYFPTKRLLLFPIIERIFDETILPRLVDFLASEPTTRAALRFWFKLIDEYFRMFPALSAAVVSEFTERGKPPIDNIDHDPGFTEALQRILLYGQKRGEVRDDLPVEMIAVYIAILYNTVFNRLIDQQSTSEYMAAVDTMLSFLETGFARRL